MGSSENILCDPWDRTQLVFRPFGAGTGAWCRPDGSVYPLTKGVARLLDPASEAHRWVLDALGVKPALGGDHQPVETVQSFGLQWTWDSEPRTDSDLDWRVASRFGVQRCFFSEKRVLDAGCGAGAQSAFLARQGASVSAVDLSSAIDVAAQRTDLRSSLLVQGDLSRLPFPAGVFDVVYCEGVLQHTANASAVMSEFTRVMKPGGILLATHYCIPSSLLGRTQWRLRELIRRESRSLPQEAIFLASGILAAGSMLPVIGFLLRKSLAVESPRMPTLKATWSNTYDAYGTHAFQRVISAEAIDRLVLDAGLERKVGTPADVIVASRRT